MWHADELGLPAVLDTMAELRRGYHGECWEPAPLLLELAARDERLTGAAQGS
jgi:3-hydroxyacyl-CoA dehydrogenase